MHSDLKEINANLEGKSAEEIVEWGLDHANGRAIVSTNFRPMEAVILHLVTCLAPDIPILWVDHGYNTNQTYKLAERLIDILNLNIHLFIPRRTAAHRDAICGGIPMPDDDIAHQKFTAEVKLEPFQRGLDELKPKVWFTAIRKNQTALRSRLNTVSMHSGSIYKISPVFLFSDGEMKAYLNKYKLPDEENYYDPTKVFENRECGLHVEG